jgi:hypothetical protein
MTIEVRQIVIRSSVGEDTPPAPPGEVAIEALERLKRELLAECRALLEAMRVQWQER